MQQVISRWVMRVALGAELQPIDRGLRQTRRVLLETAHPRGGVGKVAARIKPFGIDCVAFRQIARREARISVLDPRLGGHALKQ